MVIGRDLLGVIGCGQWLLNIKGWKGGVLMGKRPVWLGDGIGVWSDWNVILEVVFLVPGCWFF